MTRDELERELEQARDMLLTILVRDLGYMREPRYGHEPMRHQFAWQLATKHMTPEQIAKELADHASETEIEAKHDQHYRKEINQWKNLCHEAFKEADELRKALEVAKARAL